MKKNSAIVVFISGICLTTLGHYGEFWQAGYFLSGAFALLINTDT
ncbi:MAG TPA: hypothetical protein VIM16_05760 [Mucilaginibacter sp.]|jgi:hypothetical protein